MLEAPFYHSHKWVLALSDISNQVFSLYPYAKSLQTSFKTGQTPKSRRVCQAESVRQFFPRRRSVDQLPTADSASKYLLSDPSSLLLQQSNLASEHCGGVGACPSIACTLAALLPGKKLGAAAAASTIGGGGGCSQSEAFPGCLSAADRGAGKRQGTAGRSYCWEWLLGAQCCRLDPSLLHISCLQAGCCKQTRKSGETLSFVDLTLWSDVSCCH